MMPNQSKDVELLENQPQEAAKGVEPSFIPEPDVITIQPCEDSVIAEMMFMQCKQKAKEWGLSSLNCTHLSGTNISGADWNFEAFKTHQPDMWMVSDTQPGDSQGIAHLVMEIEENCNVTSVKRSNKGKGHMLDAQVTSSAIQASDQAGQST
jgi:hypothetical protein